MFASKSTSTILIISMILLSIYTSNANADECADVKAHSETLRVNAKDACDKAAQAAMGTADSTKAVAKKACDDAAIIAKNTADIAAAAACH